MKVGEYLKEQRKPQGLSHAKMAKYAGVSKRCLIKWEQGRKDYPTLPARSRKLLRDNNSFHS